MAAPPAAGSADCQRVLLLGRGRKFDPASRLHPVAVIAPAARSRKSDGNARATLDLAGPRASVTTPYAELPAGSTARPPMYTLSSHEAGGDRLFDA